MLDYGYDGDDDRSSVVEEEEDTDTGPKPTMYVEGGKVYFSPQNVFGQVDNDGTIRELEGRTVLGHVDEKRNVIGLDKKNIARVGEKYKVLGLPKPGRRAQQTGHESKKSEGGPGERKLSQATMQAIKDLTKNAIHKAMLDMFRENTVRRMVSTDGKTLIGVGTKDGRIVSEKGETLAVLQTNGKFMAPDGTEFKV